MDYVIVNGQLCRADVLYHHGVKGMKWGRRRFQNTDGSLTPAGKKRYGLGARLVRGHAGPGVYIGTKKHQLEGAKKDLARLDSGEHLSVGMTKKRQTKYDARDRRALEKKIAKLEGKETETQQSEHRGLSDKQKTALKVGVAVAGTALAAYGAYKFSEYAKGKAFKQAYERGTNASLKFMRDFDMSNSMNNFRYGSNNAEYFKNRQHGEKIFDYLLDQDMAYAKRASSNTVSAVKTLLGKNYEMPVGELLNAGVDVFIPDRVKFR